MGIYIYMGIYICVSQVSVQCTYIGNSCTLIYKFLI